MALRKKKLAPVLPAPEPLDRQLQVRIGAADLERLARIDQLSGGRGKSWAVRHGLELVEAELMALAARHDRGEAPKAKRRAPKKRSKR